jgi:outer membrane protein OmpA-like peptidoglycan-associated protein
MNDIGDWQNPQSLEFINSQQTDQFASISAQGDKLYYVYNSEKIYSVTIPPHLRQFKNNIIQGFIRNGDTNEGVGAEIIVSDAFTSEELMRMTNNPGDGKYTVVLAVGNNYNIEIRSEGFTSKSLFYDLSEETEYKEIDQNITLYPTAKLNLNIYDIDIFEPISANIKVKIEGERSLLMDLENEPNGRITLDLPLGNTYEVIIDKENFESQYFALDVSDLVVYRDFYEDIEMVPIKREIAINVADLTNNGKVRSRVRIRNKNRDEVIIVDGNETVALRVGDRYEIEATSDQGYAFNSTVIDITPEGEEVVSTEGAAGGVASTGVVAGSGGAGSGAAGMAVSINLKLQPLLVGANLTLKDILFESNSDQLNEISYNELERVVNLMLENPALNVEIGAHTDDVGSDRYNLALSERRAQSVVEFLIENKIEESRFVAKD